MKARTILLVAAAAVLAGCGLLPTVTGSGDLVAKTVSLGSFTHVAASQACKVRILPAAVESIQLIVDDNLVDYLDIRKTGVDSVQISLKQGYWYVGTTFQAEVRMPSLASLDMSGGSEATVQPGFPPLGAFEVTLSGASQADIQSLACGALAADISGGSTLTASGTATSESLTLSGGSTAELLSCPALSARVDLSGASVCWIDVGTGPIDLMASGASTLHYRGTPAFRSLDLSGGSSLVAVF